MIVPAATVIENPGEDTLLPDTSPSASGSGSPRRRSLSMAGSRRPDPPGARRSGARSGVHLWPPTTRPQTYPATNAAVPNGRGGTDQSLHALEALVVARRLLYVGAGDLSRHDRINPGHVRLGIMGAVLELDVQAGSELLQLKAVPVDADLVAHAPGVLRGGLALITNCSSSFSAGSAVRFEPGGRGLS